MGRFSWQKWCIVFAGCVVWMRKPGGLRIKDSIWLREVLMIRILLELFLHIGVRVVLAVEPPSAVLEAVDSAHAAGEEESGASVKCGTP